jgi:hypothetical protein
MDALQRNTGGRGCRRFSHGLAALALACGGSAFAQDVVSVPAAHLQHAEGSVAYAPNGDKEWHDVQPRRLLKRGDRLWTDRGSRAEVQAGGHALRLNGETQLVLENVGDTATQLSLTQGSMAATVTRLNPGDSFEVGTPNLAFRARQPGDYRIDVDTRQGVTRLVVISGSGVVYGEKGEALEVRNGQRVSFRERNLARVQQPAFAATDDFDRWADARRRGQPTVSMPNAAQGAPAPAPTTMLVNRGRDIVIAGPAASLPGAKQSAAVAQAPVARAQPLSAAPAAAAPAAAAAPQLVARAQAIPNVSVMAAAPAAVPLRVNAQGTAPPAQVPVQPRAQADARARAQAEAGARAQASAEADARAKAQAEAAARAAREQQRLAQHQRAEEERRAAASRSENDRRATAAAEAKRADERRRAVTARRTEDERRHAQVQAKREQEQKRLAAARRAEEDRRQAQARRASEEKRLAAARKAEAQKIAEARKHQLARLQEQARREEQSVQARREQQARRVEEDRRDEQARREDLYRRDELARREEDLRRQRNLADQARREQERREQEVWLRQQQYYQQPARPAPMGVPARRVS